MAFGKKKDGEARAADDAVMDDDAPLFPDETADDVAPLADAATEVAPADASAIETPAPAPEAALPSADALLSAFQTTDGDAEDRSVLIELAGEVELADLLEELNTLAAAIGLVRA